MAKKECQGCKHFGVEPDDAFCAHPEAMKRSQGFGLSLSGMGIRTLCPAPEHPLYEPPSESKKD